MLLTITTTSSPATDLGYLLHKHPDRCQSFPLSFGQVHVFYPQVGEEVTTAALLLDVNPIKLVRKKTLSLQQYVNDRPYVASSFLSVAISQVFSTALAGRCKDRPQLAETPIPLIAKISVVPCRGGEEFLRQLFEPLGYEVNVRGHASDDNFPQWGQSKYFTVELEQNIRLSDLLSHIYVLIPVLDDDKHYWVGDDEVEKLLRHGEGWLNEHPAKAQITKRYLKRQDHLTRAALARLADLSEESDRDKTEDIHAREEAAVEKPLSLNKQRLHAVLETLKENNVKRVIDLGCGQGNLLKILLKDDFFTQITGLDVSSRALKITQERLDRLHLPRKQWERLQLLQSALTYKDKRISGYEGATVIEVIEHLDLPRLAAFERVLFEFAQPKTVVVTTPNFEYNVKFENLPAGKFRHRDHRFEWTRAEFQTWGKNVAQKFGYNVQFEPIGDDNSEVGSPTQMGVFIKVDN